MHPGLEQHYGFLFEPELLKEIDAVSVFRAIPQGQQLIDIGDPITALPLVLDGAIKILKEDDQDDELLLYFIEHGDTCAMTFSCCLGNAKSKIKAVTESNTSLLLVPAQQMELWMGKYKSWRSFVLDSYHSRMTELLETIDTICLLYTSPSPRDRTRSRMPSSA